MGEQVDGARDMLQQRAQMARRLRQKLTDPLFRSAVKERCIPDSPGPCTGEASWPSSGPAAVSQATPPPSSPATSLRGRASSSSKVRQPFGSHTLARQLARRAQQPIQTPSSSQPQWDNRFVVDPALKKPALRSGYLGNSTPSSPRAQRVPSSSSSAHNVSGSSQPVRKTARPHSAGAIAKSEGVVPKRPVALNAQPIPLRGRRNDSAVEVRPRASSEKTLQRPSSERRQTSSENRVRRSSGQSPQGEEDSSDVLRTDKALQQQLQAAGEHLLSLEREQRELIGNGLRTIALSSLTSLTTPGSPPAKLDLPHSQATPHAGVTPSMHQKSTPDPHPSPSDEISPACRTESRWSIFSEGGLPGDCRTSDAERPAWLLEDGRLRAARLEGENHALRKAVARARSENDELAERRRAAEERSEHLQSVSQSLCMALLDIARLGEAAPKASAQAVEAVDKASAAVASAPADTSLRASPGNAVAAESLRRAVNLQVPSSPSSAPVETLRPVPLQPPLATDDVAAAESLRRTLSSQVVDDSRRDGEEKEKFFYIGSPQNLHCMVQQDEDARSRLLEASLNVGARMEEIFARRSKLQALCDTKVLANCSNAAIETEPPTEAGSTAPSGESEGVFPFQTF